MSQRNYTCTLKNSIEVIIGRLRQIIYLHCEGDYKHYTCTHTYICTHTCTLHVCVHIHVHAHIHVREST